MNFGPPSLCPPPLFYIVVPSHFYISPQNFPKISKENLQSTDVVSPLEPEEQIIVDKEDLLEEGYIQTKKAWTEEQDQMLLKLCSNKQSKFQQIAAMMPERNAKMCYSRFRRLTNQSKDCWSKAQNKKLKSFVEIYGENNWKVLEKQFPNRNHKQLKDHYENYLRPDLTNTEWTLEDDLLLISLLNKYGKNWKIIQKQMPNRSKNQLKNRYFGRIKRMNLRKIESQRGKQTFEIKLNIESI